MRAIGCSTNRRHDLSKAASESGDGAGFIAAPAFGHARGRARALHASAHRAAVGLQRRQHGSHQRQIRRPVRQVRYMLAIKCGAVSSPNRSIGDQRATRIERVHRRQFGIFTPGGGGAVAAAVTESAGPGSKCASSADSTTSAKALVCCSCPTWRMMDWSDSSIPRPATYRRKSRAARQRDSAPDRFRVQGCCAKIERAQRGPGHGRRARHGREMAPDQIDDAGAEHIRMSAKIPAVSPRASASRIEGTLSWPGMILNSESRPPPSRARRAPSPRCRRR